MARNEAHRQAQNRWYIKVVRKRREDWFKENGPCRKCKTWENLELDHIDPTKKVSHNIWSWADDKRLEELAKCQALCRECHLNKTLEYWQFTKPWEVKIIKEPDGMAWCTGHKVFEPVDCFGKRANRGKNGLREYCKKYRNDLLKIGKQV